VAFDIKRSLQMLQTYVSGSGYVSDCVIGEPKYAPEAQEQPFACVFMDNVSVYGLTVGGNTREIHVLLIRLYLDMKKEPAEEVEVEMAQSVQEIVSDILGDADLGGQIMTVDPAGMAGESITTTWGYEDISGLNYRIADIRVPLLVDDSATMAV
jgi:hypothetical protein